MKHRLFFVTGLLLLSACDINESMRSNAKDGTTSDARVFAEKSGCMGATLFPVLTSVKTRI